MSWATWDGEYGLPWERPKGLLFAEDKEALSAFNVPSVHVLNRRVEAFTKAHEERLGYRPSSDLLWDVVKSPVPEDDYPALMEGGRFSTSRPWILGPPPQVTWEYPMEDPADKWIADVDWEQVERGYESFKEFTFRTPKLDYRQALAQEMGRLHLEFEEDLAAEALAIPPEQRAMAHRYQVQEVGPDVVREAIAAVSKRHDIYLPDSFSDFMKSTFKGLGLVAYVGLTESFDAGWEAVRRGRALVEKVPGGAAVATAAMYVLPPARVAQLAPLASTLLNPALPLKMEEKDWTMPRSRAIGKAMGEGMVEPWKSVLSGTASPSDYGWVVVDVGSTLSVVGKFVELGAQAGRVFRGLDQWRELEEALKMQVKLSRQQDLIRRPGTILEQADRDRIVNLDLAKAIPEDLAKVEKTISEIRATVDQAGLGPRAKAALFSVGTRPIPGMDRLGIRGMEASFLRSENYVTRKIVETMFDFRQRRLERRWLLGEPHLSESRFVPDAMKGFFRVPEYWSTESKIGRQTEYLSAIDIRVNSAVSNRKTNFDVRKAVTQAQVDRVLAGQTAHRFFLKKRGEEKAAMQEAITMEVMYPHMPADVVAQIFRDRHMAAKAEAEASVGVLEAEMARLVGRGERFPEHMHEQLDVSRKLVVVNQAHLNMIDKAEPLLASYKSGTLDTRTRKLWDIVFAEIDALEVARLRAGVSTPRMNYRLAAQRDAMEGKEIVKVPIEDVILTAISAKRSKLENLGPGWNMEERVSLEADISRLTDALGDPRMDGYAWQKKQLLREVGFSKKEIEASRVWLEPAEVPAGVRYAPVPRWAEIPDVPEHVGAPGTGGYGIAPARAPGEIHMHFTGETIRNGGRDHNISGHSERALRGTNIYIDRKARMEELWAVGKPSPDSIPERYRVPIEKPLPNSEDMAALWARIDEGRSTPKDGLKIDDELEDYMAHLDEMFVVGEYRRGRWLYEEKLKEVTARGGEVRWLDSRFLVTGGIEAKGIRESRLGKYVQMVMGVPNSFVRDTTLYARPWYAANSLGSAAMLTMTTGWAAPANYARALNLRNWYGDDVAAIVREMAGTSRTAAYVAGSRKAHVVGKILRDFWSPITDNKFREAAVIHFARRGKLDLTDGGKALRDPKNKDLVAEVTLRARRAMVDFDKLGPWEREVFRHLAFIYSWEKQSTIWGAHLLVDHPISLNLLSKAGTYSEEDIDNMIPSDPLPWWLREREAFEIKAEDLPGWTRPFIRPPGDISLHTLDSLGSIATRMDFAQRAMLGTGGSLTETFMEEFLSPTSEAILEASGLSAPDRVRKLHLGKGEGFVRLPSGWPQLFPGKFINPFITQINHLIEQHPLAAPMVKRAREGGWVDPVERGPTRFRGAVGDLEQQERVHGLRIEQTFGSFPGMKVRKYEESGSRIGQFVDEDAEGEDADKYQTVSGWQPSATMSFYEQHEGLNWHEPHQGFLGEFTPYFTGSASATEKREEVVRLQGLNEVLRRNPEGFTDLMYELKKLEFKEDVERAGRVFSHMQSQRADMERDMALYLLRLKKRTKQEAVTPMQRAEAMLHALRKNKMISESEYEAEKKAREKVERDYGATDEIRRDELFLLMGRWMWQYADEEGYRDLRQSVRILDSFRKVVDEQGNVVRDLVADDIAGFESRMDIGEASEWPEENMGRVRAFVDASPAVRRVYAKGYEDWSREKTLQEPTGLWGDDGTEPSGWELSQDWKEDAFEIVVIDGVEYPPFEEMEFLRLDGDNSQIVLAEIAGRRDWKKLTRFEKMALGRPVPAGVSQGYKDLKELEENPLNLPVKGGKEDLQRRISSVEHALGPEIGPEWRKDYNFSEMSLGARLLELDTFTERPWRPAWESLEGERANGDSWNFVTELKRHVEMVESASEETRPVFVLSWTEFVENQIEPLLDLMGEGGAFGDFGQVVRRHAGSSDDDGFIDWLKRLVD